MAMGLAYLKNYSFLNKSEKLKVKSEKCRSRGNRKAVIGVIGSLSEKMAQRRGLAHFFWNANKNHTFNFIHKKRCLSPQRYGLLLKNLCINYTSPTQQLKTKRRNYPQCGFTKNGYNIPLISKKSAQKQRS